MTLFYPRRNIVGVPPEWIARDLDIIGESDLKENPIPAQQFLNRPLIRRGRFLCTAWDREKRQYRRFYRNAFRHEFMEPMLRIGLMFDELQPASDPFPQTPDGCRELAMVLHRLRELPAVVYSDGLAVVR